MDKEFYNEASSEKLGWDPQWFGWYEFDEILTDRIKEWQKSHGIKADGLCGPTTYRRIYTERESKIDDYINVCPSSKDASFIVNAGNFIEIEWPRVVLWSEENGLKCNKYSSYAGKKRDVKMFVNHWDVCLSSSSCERVLNRRGVSVHFCIDNDGTIYQLLDMNHAAWHAGSRKWNHSSVGVEISNAYYLKYQEWYKNHGFGERPVIAGESCHGSHMNPFTGFYPIQIEALKALWKACHDGLGIPYKCPLDKDGNTLKKVSTAAAANRFKGYVSHFHLTRGKIDCAGLDIKKILDEIK